MFAPRGPVSWTQRQADAVPEGVIRSPLGGERHTLLTSRRTFRLSLARPNGSKHGGLARRRTCMMQHIFGPNTRRCADDDRRSSHRYVSRKVGPETSSLVDLMDGFCVTHCGSPCPLPSPHFFVRGRNPPASRRTPPRVREAQTMATVKLLPCIVRPPKTNVALSENER